MTTRTKFHGCLRLGPAVAVALAAAASSGIATPLMAQEWPKLQQGMWEITRTMRAPGGGSQKTVTAKRCVSPSDDWKSQNARLASAGCTFSPVEHAGSTYSFTSSCKVMGTSSESTTTIVVEGDAAYTLTVVGTTDGQPIREEAKGKRVGACTP